MIKRWLLLLMLATILYAKTPDTPAQKAVQALPIHEAVRIDGELSESVWQQPGISDFTQLEPQDGTQPSEKSTVWVAYDKKALYVAALLEDSQPEKIVRRLGRRDDFVDADWFLFSVDPYYDRRSGFTFAVNPAGSILDETLANDGGEDSTWDGIWEYASRVTAQGWVVEMRIPFDQLRFKKKDVYLWGVDFRRVIQRKKETVAFVWIPVDIRSGYVSHFARLEGISNIDPGHYVEMVPYMLGRAGFSPAETGNPFATGQAYRGDAGLDAKVALKSNLILDATVNPDFGQVEVDPAQINLSAFETYYSEKRPFFIEGSSIFNFGFGGATRNVGINWSNPEFFYSRRIGRAPQLSPDTGGFLSVPEASTILGAAKFTGKIGDNWNVGFLNAITDSEYAEIDEEGVGRKEKVEPFSYYGVLRVQKEFNEGGQGLGFMATALERNLSTDALKMNLNRQALSFAADGWLNLDKNRTWVLTGWLGGTSIAGSPEEMRNIQESPLHYFQRPDADYLKWDESRTSLSGWAGRFTLNKQKGRFMFNAALGAVSPGFDASDLGYQWRGDFLNGHLFAGYNWLHPGKVFRYFSLYGALFQSSDFGWNNVGRGGLLGLEGQFLNYWSFASMFFVSRRSFDKELSRGGPLVEVPSSFQEELNLSSDSRKALVLSLYGRYSRSAIGGYDWGISPTLTWKPRSNISLSVGPDLDFDHSFFQWVANVDDSLNTATYGKRYVFAEINQKTLAAVIRLNWVFTPRLSLQVYLQPLLGVGAYSRFKELARPASGEFNYYGENGSTIILAGDEYVVDPDGPGPAPSFTFANPDFNLKSLRGTVVLRWEYRPGSTLYAVWTQNRADMAYPGDFRFGRDFRAMLSAQGDNLFMLKFTYRLKI